MTDLAQVKSFPGRHGVAKIEDNAAIEVLSHERQAEDRLCQRTNAVAMPFSDATLMK